MLPTQTPRVCVKPQDDANEEDNEDIAEMILEERVTRSVTYYKVRTIES